MVGCGGLDEVAPIILWGSGTGGVGLLMRYRGESVGDDDGVGVGDCGAGGGGWLYWAWEWSERRDWWVVENGEGGWGKARGIIGGVIGWVDGVDDFSAEIPIKCGQQSNNYWKQCFFSIPTPLILLQLHQRRYDGVVLARWKSGYAETNHVMRGLQCNNTVIIDHRSPSWWCYRCWTNWSSRGL